MEKRPRLSQIYDITSHADRKRVRETNTHNLVEVARAILPPLPNQEQRLVTLSIDLKPRQFVFKMERDNNPRFILFSIRDLDGSDLSSSSITISTPAQTNKDHFRINCDLTNTTVGYEGNGLAISLIIASMILIKKLSEELTPNNFMVYAHSHDISRGAEETSRIGSYRDLWTTNVRRMMGFTNDPNTVASLMGEDTYRRLGSPDKHLVKIIRKGT